MIESIYFHIPFCKNICSYCDFCKNYYDEFLVSKYLDALNEEFMSLYKNELIKTVYIGGGSPSSLSVDELNKLFLITNKIKLAEEYEFTFECNYNDINEDMLMILKNNKVNRLSIGIESFNNKFENILIRKINEIDMIKTINLCKKYFNNINIDLMYSINGQSMEDLIKDLNIAVNLNINHISVYALIIEDNTLLKIKNIKEVDFDFQSEMYYKIIDILTRKGFNHYEISNFSKKGYESKHNLVYWNNLKYYGFGAGASGFIGKVRYDNTKSIKSYINGKRKIYEEVISKRQMMNDEIMLSLRKISGINKKVFLHKYGVSVKKNYNLSELINDGFLVEGENNIFIPEKYLFVSNEIIIKILE